MLSPKQELEDTCEESVSSTFGLLGGFSVTATDTGATASLACFEWLGRRNSISEPVGVPPARSYPTSARFKFGNGRTSGARFAAGVPVGRGGEHGEFTAFLTETEIPAFLREEAPESSGEQLD